MILYYYWSVIKHVNMSTVYTYTYLDSVVSADLFKGNLAKFAASSVKKGWTGFLRPISSKITPAKEK